MISARTTGFIAIITSFWSIGCGDPKPGDTFQVWIDPQFGSDGVAGVIEALDEWQIAANTQIQHPLSLYVQIGNKTCSQNGECSFMTEGCDTSCRSVITIHPAPTSYIQGKSGSDKVGMCISHWHDGVDGAWHNSNTYVSTDLHGDEWRKVVLHEFGHALGLQHSPSGTIMCQNVPCASDVITSDDIQQYLDVRK